MNNWDNRSQEVKSLLNPAFCGRLIYEAVVEYKKKVNLDFPFPLVYLILPLVLPRQIRIEISSKTNLINWVQNHHELLYNFWKRTSDLVEITNEAIEFMIRTGYLIVTDKGELSNDYKRGTLSKTKYVDKEVGECICKAGHVGRWFANAGKVETIFICLGVRP